MNLPSASVTAAVSVDSTIVKSLAVKSVCVKIKEDTAKTSEGSDEGEKEEGLSDKTIKTD